LAAEKVIFRVHALQRMFERGITVEDARRVIKTGEVLQDYPDDTPYPSRLVFGWVAERPLHVVVAYNKAAGEEIVITAYEPAPAQWESGFKRRKR